MALFQLRKMVSFQYLFKDYCVGFIFYTQVYNHKVDVKFDLGLNPPIIMGVMTLFQLRKMVSFRYLLKRFLYWIHILYTGI